MTSKYEYPRIRNLPIGEQKEFEKWLYGKTVPLIENVSDEEQDAYYPWDYSAWKLYKA